MNHDPDKLPQRKSIRLRDFDYSQIGGYYVTICTQHRMELFGSVIDGMMVLNAAGNMALQTWNEIPLHYHNYHIDAIQIMPNHMHGILMVMDTSNNEDTDSHGQTQGPVPTGRLALFEVVQRYKSLTTHRYIHGVRSLGWTPFTKRLWQGNFYERVLRNDRELEDRREYIRNNLLRWHLDEYNKLRQSK